jgi:hypothetical protein
MGKCGEMGVLSNTIVKVEKGAVYLGRFRKYINLKLWCQVHYL